MAAKKKVRIGSSRSRPVDEAPLLEEMTQDRRRMGGTQVTVRAGLEELAGNPDNPREDLGDLEELAASMKARGQLQPVTVISREAFVKLKPEHEGAFDDKVRFVVLYGNRRLAAAPLAGLKVLKVDVASSPESASDIRASALVENIHRKNLAPLEEAREVAALVEEVGSGAEAARQLGLSKGWVSQRLALLKLTPELQKKLRQGDLKVKEARSLGTLPVEEQQAAWEKGVYRVNGAKAAVKETPPSPQPVPPQQHQAPQRPEKLPGGVNPSHPSSNGTELKTNLKNSGGEGPVQLMLDLEWRGEAKTLARQIYERLQESLGAQSRDAVLDELKAYR